MTAPIQPPETTSLPSPRLIGWRSTLALLGVVALVGAVLLLLGAVEGRLSAASARRPFALIHLARNAPRIVEDQAQNGTESDYALLRRTQVEIIRSEPVLWSALKRDEVKRLGVASKADPVAWLKDGLDVEAPAGSEIIRVSFRGSDAAESATIATAVARAYVLWAVEGEERRTTGRLMALEKALAECRESVTAKRRVLRKLRDDNAGQADETADELREEIRCGEETGRWLRRELERQRVEGRAPSRVQILADAGS